MPASSKKSLLEVQFPIGQLSLESYKERKANHGQILKPLGKWWGEKPMVLTRAMILGALFDAAEDPDRWPDDMEIFLKLMCFDPAGMWKRKKEPLPADICFSVASADEKILFVSPERWAASPSSELRRRRLALEKRAFYSMTFAEQRKYCCRVEEIDGPPNESWEEINSYCNTNAGTLSEWVEQTSIRKFGHILKFGDAFCGSGSIPFEAAEIGCDVFASDLNPAAACLTWGALNIIGGGDVARERFQKAQQDLLDIVEEEIAASGFETSEEGWRLEAALYCVEIKVPDWDNWKVPVSPTWWVAPKSKTWVELVPDEKNKRFEFIVKSGGDGYVESKIGTKQGGDVVCPASLWALLNSQGKTSNASRQISLSSLLSSYGGHRLWSKSDIHPVEGDFFGERIYCLKWQKTIQVERGGKFADKVVTLYREPTPFDMENEKRIALEVEANLDEWQRHGWIPNWRIRAGYNTNQPIRDRGWTHWHHLFTPRQLMLNGLISKSISEFKDADLRKGLMLSLGKVLNQNARLCGWSPRMDVEKTDRVFVNQALNPMANYGARGIRDLKRQIIPSFTGPSKKVLSQVTVEDARYLKHSCDIWITDPPYADAVNYEEVSEYFLAWYACHISECYPGWYSDSKRDHAVKGEDSAFRVSMAECYSNLTKNMPDNGLQVLMFTHKDTDVWEDLALIMWSAGLQVKQVWSIATETPGAGIRVGNYVQATYNMVLRKRPVDAPMGFVDLVIPQIKTRVEEVIRHMRDSQIQSGGLNCGYTDTDYLLAAQAVAAEVVTGFSSIDGIDLDKELRTPNKQRGNSVLKDMMNQAKRTAVDFLVPLGLEEHLRRSPDGTSAYQFWRSLAPEEKFLLKSLELEAGGVCKIGAFQDLGRAYGIADYEDLLGPVVANEARSKLPNEFPRADLARWDDVPANERNQFSHSVTRHLYHALKMLAEGADADRAVKHLVDSTNFWSERQGKHLVILAYLYQTTGTNEAWDTLRPQLQTLRLAVENHRA